MQTPHRKAPDQEMQTFLLVTGLAAQKETVYAGKLNHVTRSGYGDIRGQLNPAQREREIQISIIDLRQRM